MSARRRLFIAAITFLVCAGMALVWRISQSPRNRIYHPPADIVPALTGAAAVARGKHMVEAVAVCTICHGDNLGGKLAFQDAFLGQGYTTNLTSGRGGVGQYYTVADWVRSIRYGVNPSGHGIPFMPSDYFHAITDEDLGAVIAYLKSLPPVDNTRTHVEIHLPARLLIDLGVLGELVRAAKIDYRVQPPKQARETGRYLVTVGGCTFCHGVSLKGGQGPEPGAPPGPNLTPNGPLGRWSFAQFANTMRNGVDPNGHAMYPQFMPWLAYRKMTDDELKLIWDYLQSQPA